MTKKLDPQNIKKSILTATIQHPMTLFPAGLAMLGGLGFALFDGALITGGVAIAGLTVGAGSWVYNYFSRKSYFTDKYVKQIQAEAKAERAKILVNLSDNLEAVVEKASNRFEREQAGQCLNQLTMSQEKFDDFVDLLDSKLNQGELTYTRFIVSAEQTHLAVLDNLQKIVERFKAVKSIDLDYIEKGLKKLAKEEQLGTFDESDAEERRQLEKRKALHTKGMTDINKLITENETALTAINEAMIEISQVKMMKGQAETVAIKDALKNLEDMARQSQEYSVE